MSYMRELRQQQGLSIAGLSHKIQVNPTVLGQAERRQLAPSKNFREAVSSFFAVPEEQLFGDDGLAV